MKHFNLAHIKAKFIECILDERGAATAEYLIVTGVTLPLVFVLFHPDNGFYQAAREQFDMTILLLRLPAP
jgi:hypothetical protein